MRKPDRDVRDLLKAPVGAVRIGEGAAHRKNRSRILRISFCILKRSHAAEGVPGEVDPVRVGLPLRDHFRKKLVDTVIDRIPGRRTAVILNHRRDHIRRAQGLVFRQRPPDGHLIFQRILRIPVAVERHYYREGRVRLRRRKKVILEGSAIFHTHILKIIRHRRHHLCHGTFGKCQCRLPLARHREILDVKILLAEGIHHKRQRIALHGERRKGACHLVEGAVHPAPGRPRQGKILRRKAVKRRRIPDRDHKLRRELPEGRHLCQNLHIRYDAALCLVVRGGGDGKEQGRKERQGKMSQNEQFVLTHFSKCVHGDPP